MGASLREIAELFAKAGKRLYLVGGYVRNCLLGLPVSDVDIASSALPEEVFALLQGICGVQIVNRRLGTVAVFKDGVRMEHTAFRKESYGTGGSHTPEEIEIGVTLEQDALRRDFSVNALYYDILSGQLHDPTGRGREDIAAKRLRTTTADSAEIIRDDGLRLLRMVRFASELGFTIDRDLFAKARENRRLIRDVSKERIAEELKKILLADQKYGIAGKVAAQKRGLLYLHASGLLEELVPEFAGAKGLGQGEYHKYTVLMHSINTVACAPGSLILRLAALFHDVAKPEIWKKTGRMVGHDRAGAKIAAARLSALGFSRAVCEAAAELVRIHMYDLSGGARESRVRIKAQQIGYERFLQLADLREADVHGSGFEKGSVPTADRFREIAEKMQREHVPMCLSELAVSGEDIMRECGLQPGPEIGALLRDLLRFCALKPAQNQKDKLLHRVKQSLKNLAKREEA